MRVADGVLPDEVNRSGLAGSWLVGVDLAADLDQEGVKAWLEAADAPRRELLQARHDEARVASVAMAIGPGLLTKAAVPEENWPAGLRPEVLPAPPLDAAASAHDVLFYVTATSEAVVAEFLRALCDIPGTAALAVEHGYRRLGEREVFGSRDGLRNVATPDRRRVAFVDTAEQPDEPDWADGGSYLAHLKIRQDTTAWAALSPDTQEAVIGRRHDDGSRLDLAAGTDPHTEGEYSDASNPPVTSHVRKAGPRGADNDPVTIFRRGTPYYEINQGRLEQGLQFVSFQASWLPFLTILQRWMLNAGFPTPTAGVDALIDPARALVKVLTAGYYFTLPPDSRYLGAGLFDPDTRQTSHLVIHKTVLDASGNPDPTARLDGATFQVTGPDGPIGESFHTDAAGRARSGPLPTGVPLTITETAAPEGSEISQATMEITLTCRPQRLDWTNRRTAPPNQYGA